MSNEHREEGRGQHSPDCTWERTTSAECAYRATHHYCPHPEHACSCPVLNPTEEEAEAILREHGTSGKEVTNDFIERLLKERSEAIAVLAARDTEIREVLEGLRVRRYRDYDCWCRMEPTIGDHEPRCLAARGLWERVQDS